MCGQRSISRRRAHYLPFLAGRHQAFAVATDQVGTGIAQDASSAVGTYVLASAYPGAVLGTPVPSTFQVFDSPAAPQDPLDLHIKAPPALTHVPVCCPVR